jgi:hypothetical protein
MHTLTRMFLFAAIALTISSAAFGQETTGSIEGTVKDSADALVPNVEVMIMSAKSAASGTTPRHQSASR